MTLPFSKAENQNEKLRPSHVKPNESLEKTAMAKVRIVRTIGWVQMVFSIALIIAITTTYFVYRSSLADYSRTLGAAIFSVSAVLTVTAETMTARQDLLRDVQDALKKTRGVVEVLKSSVATHSKKIPQYSDDLKKTAAVVSKFGKTLIDLGDGLMIKLPTDITWQSPRYKFMPQIVRTTPWIAQANALKTHGQNIRDLSGNLDSIAVSLETDMPKLNATLIDTSQKTLELLHDMEDVTTKLGPQVWAQTIEKLKAASEKLSQAGDLANRAECLMLVLLVTGLFLALLLALNSWAMLLLAPQHANG